MKPSAPILDAPRRRGRPSDSTKREAILDAAQRAFADHGFAATNMDAVAAAAGVSKLTVYRHFSTKAALFAEAVASKCRTILGDIEGLAASGGGPRAALVSAGRAFLGLVLHPDAMAVHRLVAAERGQAPELGRLFYEHAVVTAKQRFTTLVGDLVTRGALAGDPPTIAQDYLALLRGRPMMHAEFGVEPLGPDELAAHVEHCADLLLRAYRPGA